MGFLDNFKIKTVTKDDLHFTKIEEIYSANYYQPQLEKVMSTSLPINNEFILEKFPKGMTTVYKYNTYCPKNVRFVKDDKNERDKNAVKIFVNSIHVGYIPEEKSRTFRKWMDEKRIYNINLKISGGEYLIKVSDKKCYKDSRNYKIVIYLLLKKS